MKLTKRNRQAIATCLRRWAHLDIQTGAAKEAANVKLDDHAMCLDIAEKRIRHIELLLMNPRPARFSSGGGGAEQAGDDAATKQSGACSANVRISDSLAETSQQHDKRP
jgi:hypothetical protein